VVYKIKQPEIHQKSINNFPIYLGIDPGVNGAIAFYRVGSNKLKIEDMPTFKQKVGKKERKQIDSKQLVKIIKSLKKINHAFVEKVNAYPQQGVVSVFNFGYSYGVIIGILAGRSIPITYVLPRKWKEDINLQTKKISRKRPTTNKKEFKDWDKLRAKGKTMNKEFARDRAIKEFPNYKEYFKRKKDDGRAEAALIALWGATKNNLQGNNN
jgi:crossover junction endodeoxyribonuclease RuvC